MSSRNLVITIVVVVVVLLAGWFLVKSQQTQVTPAPQTPPTVNGNPTPTASESSPSAMMAGTVVTVSNTGFTPKVITIKAGDSVTWTNSDSANHTVNSSPHPTHTDNPFLNLGTIAPGANKSLSFPTAGTYKYHDHLNPTFFGSVTVE